uniref:Uncharacterized protein n=1 Tax=Opuntia streptacantha TaxID=393608 RepID=A0A7C8ZZR0_OPUST
MISKLDKAPNLQAIDPELAQPCPRWRRSQDQIRLHDEIEHLFTTDRVVVAAVADLLRRLAGCQQAVSRIKATASEDKRTLELLKTSRKVEWLLNFFIQDSQNCTHLWM